MHSKYISVLTEKIKTISHKNVPNLLIPELCKAANRKDVSLVAVDIQENINTLNTKTQKTKMNTIRTL